jgi:mannitol 2-dehydrogenase
MEDIFGPLANQPAYVEAFSAALSSLWQRGTRATLERYLRGETLLDA